MARRGASKASLEAKVEITLADQRWRLNNLYVIEDKAGSIIPFRMNDQQIKLCDDIHNLNVILKARQLGFSTLVAMLWLDVSLFNSNTRCGIIDATIDDAKKKLRKIALAYKHLPEWLKSAVPLKTSNATTIEFANGSAIEVGTSHRGGTLQYLHISEFAKISARFPDKAREIRTGALNTIQAGQTCVIESSAEGQGGDYYDICQIAEGKSVRGARLTPLDFKFHFFPWWQAPEYEIDPEGVLISAEMRDYFASLKLDNGTPIKLSAGQQAWYVKKAETQRDDMKREYPSTSKEAFEAAIEGAIFGPWLTTSEKMGRIGCFPVHDGVPVHTFWDIGRKDYTSIWFAQVFAGRVRCVHFLQDTMEELPYYTELLLGTDRAKATFPEYGSRKQTRGLFAERGWIMGNAVFPHDMKITEFGAGRSRIEQALNAGFTAKLATVMGLHDGINAARATIPLCEFDEQGCTAGLTMLKTYRWEWDETRAVWRSGTPRHDLSSHGSDAFRYLATSWREVPAMLEPKKAKPDEIAFEVNPNTRMINTNMSVRDIVEMKTKLAKMGQKRGLQF